jgi:hypothetical protein
VQRPKPKQWSCSGNLQPPSSRAQIGYSPQTTDRRFFGTSSYGMDLGGQPASYSGKEYSQLFKEITGALS